MERSNDFYKMLEMLPGPAFTVQDGHIEYCNNEASLCNINAEEPISKYVLDGQEEFETFRDGILHLPLQLNGQTVGATATILDGRKLIRIVPNSASQSIKSISRVCADLRYPFSNLSMLTERILRQINDQKTTAAVRMELSKILRILNNASNAEMFTADRTSHMEERDVCHLLCELLDECKLLLAQADIELNYTLPSQIIFTLLDWTLLRQAMYNLLDNAAKATGAGGVIQVDLTQTKNTLRITVKDSGHGIPEAKKANLFTRYADHSNDLLPGAGLGMTLIAAAATAHGGTVLVSSDTTGTQVALTIAVRHGGLPPLRSHLIQIVTTQDDGKVMLSNVLPASVFKPKK